jgi:SLT domain-containing protein
LKQDEMGSLLSEAAQIAGVPASWVPGLMEIARRESSFNPRAKNPKSSAYGLFQFLDGTWKTYGQGLDRNNPLHQAIAAIRYVKQRYGTPDKALAFWNENKWY